MKTLKVEKNRAFVYHEMSDRTCEDILNQGQSSLRFDLIYGEEDADFKKWRGTIEKNDDGEPSLEIRDYDNNERFRHDLEPKATVLDASTLAMRHVWEWIIRHEDQFPPANALPIIEG